MERSPPPTDARRSRCVFAMLLLLFAATVSGCTTSRAVLAWHDGWKAEAKGRSDEAIRLYGEAIGRNSRLTGAALNRIRLMALQPDRRTEAGKRLTELLEKQGSDPAVAAFAAKYALLQGDPKLARQRLAAVRAATPDDPPEAAGALREAELAVLAAEGRWHEAHALAAELPVTPGNALLRGIAAWQQRADAAASAAVAVAPSSKQRSVLQALLAREAGDWPAVTAALGAMEGADLTPMVLALQAEASLHRGEAARALDLASEAARRDPADPFVAEVWAAAHLGAGQAALARDLLAGLTARGAGWSAWFNLGICQVKLGDLAAAATAFDAAASRCPTCAPATRNRDAMRQLGF